MFHPFSNVKAFVAIVAIIFTTISAWIMGIRMRRRARKALGRDVSSGELTSINLWMNVQDAEHREDPRTEPRLF